jgi:hypothetical protein
LGARRGAKTATKRRKATIEMPMTALVLWRSRQKNIDHVEGASGAAAIPPLWRVPTPTATVYLLLSYRTRGSTMP